MNLVWGCVLNDANISLWTYYQKRDAPLKNIYFEVKVPTHIL